MREGTTSRVTAADRLYGEFTRFTVSVREILETTLYFIPFHVFTLCIEINLPTEKNPKVLLSNKDQHDGLFSLSLNILQ